MISIPRAACRFAALFLLITPMTVMAGDKWEGVYVRARVFNVPQSAAEALMAAEDFRTNVSGSLAKLSAMVGRKEALVLANPSVQTILPGKGDTHGLVSMQFELAVSPSPAKEITLTIDVDYEEQKILTSTPLKREEPVFLGSFDASKSAAGGPPGTILVFLVLQ